MAITSAVLNKCLAETTAWRQAVSEMEDKNIQLKNRLSAIAKSLDERYPALMERVEYFYDLFLKQDEVSSFLVNELKTLKKLLEQEMKQGSNGLTESRIILLQDRLNSQLQKARQDFARVSVEFENYLEEAGDKANG